MSVRSQPTVCFLILPNVHLMDLAGPAQVFYEAGEIGPVKYKITYCGISGEERSEQGLMLSGLSTFSKMQLGKGDILFIPGIDFKRFVAGAFSKDIRTIRDWLHRQLDAGVQIASICSGALILAEAGILDGKKCTTHWKCIGFMTERYPRIKVQTDQLYVYDKD